LGVTASSATSWSGSGAKSCHRSRRPWVKAESSAASVSGRASMPLDDFDQE
jgi:hypothetical protein